MVDNKLFFSVMNFKCYQMKMLFIDKVSNRSPFEEQKASLMGRMTKEHVRAIPLAPSVSSEPLATMQHGKLRVLTLLGKNQEKLEFWEPQGSHTYLLRVSPEKQPKN